MAASDLDLAVVPRRDAGPFCARRGFSARPRCRCSASISAISAFLAKRFEGGVVPIVARPSRASSCRAPREPAHRRGARASLIPFGDEGALRWRARALFALNEVALTRGAMGRIIEFSLDVSDSPIACMKGDGVVVAARRDRPPTPAEDRLCPELQRPGRGAPRPAHAAVPCALTGKTTWCA